MRALLALLIVACGSVPAAAAQDETPVLTLTFGGGPLSFSTTDLLARPDAATITIPADVAYGKPMTYRAVPLLGLLGDMMGDLTRLYDTIEATSTDGFVAQIPLALVMKGAQGGSVAWIAVEDPAAPWPPLPGKGLNAGPFYLVWEHPESSKVSNELWPYQLSALSGAESPAHRWPQMAVDERLPVDAPARRGQAVFITQCLSCHRMKGGGAAEMGPDLGKPMSPIRYMSAEGLRALIRNPKAVRTWPQQQMPGFDTSTLPDADLDALIAYLAHLSPEMAPR